MGQAVSFRNFSSLPEAFERAQYSYKLHYFQPDKIILKEVRKPARTLSEEEVKSGLNEINSCISQKQYSHAFSHLYTFYSMVTASSQGKSRRCGNSEFLFQYGSLHFAAGGENSRRND